MKIISAVGDSRKTPFVEALRSFDGIEIAIAHTMVGMSLFRTV